MDSIEKLFGLAQKELVYNFGFTMKLLVTSFGLLALVFFLVIPSYAQETSSLEILVQNTKGDQVDYYEMNVLVYENNYNIPILEIVPTSNPFTIDSLTLGKQYQIDVYVNSMYGATYFVNLDESEKYVEVSIPTSGGFRLTVLYNDAYTPIDGASVSISSHDRKHWRDGITSKDGKTMRFWMQPTNPNEYYNIEISLSQELVFQGPQVSLSPTSQPEIEIVTNWPPIVDHLITIESYKNNAEKISKSDGDFVVELIDAENNVVDTSPVSRRGESYFSNIKVGEYILRLVNTSFGPANFEEWALKRISISGMEERFKLGNIQDERPVQSEDIVQEQQDENPIQSEDIVQEQQGEKQSCNCVAFRLDDIQDFWLTKSQMRLIDIFQEQKIPLTIGMVGAHIGEDPTIVNFIKTKLDSGNVPLELANHSWNDDRFIDMTKSEQITAITKTNDRIYEIFGKRPTTFVPAGNLFNDDTVTILKENNFTHLSATSKTDPSPYVLNGASFYHFPQTAETGQFGPGSTYFVGVTHDKTLDEVKTSIKQHGYAVVMMHPQEHSVLQDGALQNIVNEKQIQELEQLIDKLNEEGIDIVPLGKINLDAPNREKFVYRYEPTCNCIAFRLDTVQDWWLGDVNTEIINIFNQKQTPLTIGIIGNFIGSDPNIVEFLRNTLKQNQGTEIAINGWNYEDFSKLTKDEQKSLLDQSSNSIQKILEENPKVFIPPNNKFNDETLSALQENGFTHISSSQVWSTPPYPLTNEPFYYFPFTANTGVYSPDKVRYEGLPYQTTFDAIVYSVESNGFAVVMMSPQDFSLFENGEYLDQINSEQLDELDKLIDEIINSNLEIVPISQINLDSVSLEIPDWIKNNAGWWAEDQITDSDFTSGIEFMIKEKIIRIPELPESESTIEKKVPDWIKNNAGWWAQDLISDEDFVNGIEYLVKNGIILV